MSPYHGAAIPFDKTEGSHARASADTLDRSRDHDHTPSSPAVKVVAVPGDEWLLDLLRWARARARTLPEPVAELALTHFTLRVARSYSVGDDQSLALKGLWRHSVADAFRGAGAQLRTSDALPDWELVPSKDSPPTDLCQDAELKNALSSAVRHLDGRERTLIHLRYGAGKSFSSIARIFGVRESSARSLHRRTLTKLSRMQALRTRP